MEKKHHPLVAWLLGAATRMLVASAAKAQTNPRARTREKGKPGQAGAKLARMADEHRIGIMRGLRCYAHGR